MYLRIGESMDPWNYQWICEFVDLPIYGHVDLWTMNQWICGESIILRICGPMYLWIYVSVDL